MTDTPTPARARAEAAFRTVRTVTPEELQSAMAEYRATQAAALDNMAKAAGDEDGERRQVVRIRSRLL